VTLGAEGGTSERQRILTVAVLGELAIILLLIIQVASSMGAFGVKTVTRTTTVGGPAAVDCLLPLPANATTSYYSTQNFTGTMVAYADGEQLFYPEYTCPQPVSNATGAGGIGGTTAYKLALAAVTNRTFAADENGSVYLYSQSCGSMASSICGAFGPTVTLYFYNYGNQSEPGCSNGTSRRVVEAGIGVTFNSLDRFAGTYINTGTWNLSDPTITVMSANQISLFENSCSFT
jgi:hypothetical protein